MERREARGPIARVPERLASVPGTPRHGVPGCFASTRASRRSAPLGRGARWKTAYPAPQRIGAAKLGQISVAGFNPGLVANTAAVVINTADFATARNSGSSGYFILDNSDANSGSFYWDADGGSGSNATLRCCPPTSILSEDDCRRHEAGLTPNSWHAVPAHAINFEYRRVGVVACHLRCGFSPLRSSSP